MNLLQIPWFIAVLQNIYAKIQISHPGILCFHQIRVKLGTLSFRVGDGAQTLSDFVVTSKPVGFEGWDRFYLVNYVNFVKVPVVDVADADEEVDLEDAWDDLTDEIDSKTQCLFCEEILASPESTFKHMKTAHSFDLKAIQRQHKLKFYDTMKLVNYFRHCQQHAKPPSIEEVNQIPDPSLWNRPEFYFPVYDEDPLLTAIGDAESDTDNEQLGIGDVDSLTEDLKKHL